MLLALSLHLDDQDVRRLLSLDGDVLSEDLHPVPFIQADPIDVRRSFDLDQIRLSPRLDGESDLSALI